LKTWTRVRIVLIVPLVAPAPSRKIIRIVYDWTDKKAHRSKRMLARDDPDAA
jgi:hypothetical protein